MQSLRQDEQKAAKCDFDEFTDTSKVLQPLPSAKTAWRNFTIDVFFIHSSSTYYFVPFCTLAKPLLAKFFFFFSTAAVL